MTKEDAIKIAEELLKKEGVVPISFRGTYFHTKEEHDVVFPYRDRWWVGVQITEELVDPDEIVIVVDDLTGKAEFRPGV